MNKDELDGLLALKLVAEKRSFRAAADDLGLSPRVVNALRSRGIERVGQVLQMERDDLLAIRNFGPRSFNELWDKLKEHNFLPADAEAAPLVDDDDLGAAADAFGADGEDEDETE